MVGLAFELHDTAAARCDLKTASDDVRQSLALRIKYQHVDPSFLDILMYSFCFIGLLTGTSIILFGIHCLLVMFICFFLEHLYMAKKETKTYVVNSKD